MEYSGGAVAVEVVAWLRWRMAKEVMECVPTISQSMAMYLPAIALGFGCAGESSVGGSAVSVGAAEEACDEK